MHSVLLIDDSRTFLRIIECIIKDNLNIIGHSQNGEDGFMMYQSLRPDLVLLDITMPNCSGKECLAKIMAFDPNAKVIMVSSIGDEETLKECLRLGAKGFVRKDKLSAHSGPANNVLFQTISDVIAG